MSLCAATGPAYRPRTTPQLSTAARQPLGPPRQTELLQLHLPLAHRPRTRAPNLAQARAWAGPGRVVTKT